MGNQPRIHQAAAVGFSRAADAYERGRPEYPEEAIRFISDRLFSFRDEQRDARDQDATRGAADGLKIVDLAAGTGKFTKVLVEIADSDLARGKSLIASIAAVEPVAEMRAKCEARFREREENSKIATSRIATVTAVEGTAENLPFADHSLDVLTVAQAFHWFDGSKALPEIHRVLKPGGLLLLIWNVRDERTRWVQEMTDLMTPYEGTAPRYRSFKWREAFDRTTLFTPFECYTFKNVSVGPIDMMMDRVASVSFVASLSESERSSLLERMRQLYERVLSSAENSTENHVSKTDLVMPYETNIFLARSVL